MEETTIKPGIKKAYVEYMQFTCSFGHDSILKHMVYEFNNFDAVKHWCSRPKQELRDNCDAIKVYAFWPVLYEEEHLRIGNKRVMKSTGLDIATLNQLQILEDLTEIAKEVCHIPDFIRGILSIGHPVYERKFDVARALEWVKSTGNPKVIQKLETFGPLGWPSLEIFFFIYQQHIERVAKEFPNLKDELESAQCTICVKKSELLKTEGNKEFNSQRFESAIKWYTEAIDHHPKNHLLYGNRALCYLRLSQYMMALADGKRATILDQKWAKGHYRFCDALFALGEYMEALQANLKAHKLCEEDQDGIKELTQQVIKFKQVLEEKQAEAGISDFQIPSQTSNFENAPSEDLGLSAFLYTRMTKKKKKKVPPVSTVDLKKTDSTESVVDSHMENTKTPSELPAGHNKDTMPTDSRSKSPQGKSKKNIKLSEKPRAPELSKTELLEDRECNPSTTSALITLNGFPEAFSDLIHTGHKALIDKSFHCAEQVFSQLLDILNPADLKKLHLATIDYVVLIYGRASALLGIGQPEELTMAEQQFNVILDKYTKQRFNCLAFYGIGRVHLRQNRFAEAASQFIKSQIMLNHKIVPGVLKWPTTSVVIEETRPEKLQLLLERFIGECKFPPKPDAICRYTQCQGRKKKEIYFTDPDFEGFIRIFCCQLCKVELHLDCWKKLKTTEYPDRNDKDFLQSTCLTPDCKGSICHILIYGSSGLVKWQDEVKIAKVKIPQKPIVKQKNASLKLNVEQKRKLRRRLHQNVTLNSAADIKDITSKEENSSKEGILTDTQIKPCTADPILQQVIENADIIKKGVPETSLLIDNLLLWHVISQEECETYSASAINSSQDEFMAILINHVSKNSNKVKTRIFLHLLNELPEVDSKLRIWLKEINNIGLVAAEAFLSRYGDCLQKLDFGSLCHLWNETYGNKLNSLIPSSKDEIVMNYFREASPEKVRYLIWLLEDNKKSFQCPDLYEALDYYFTMMDRPCVVLKKQENQENIGTKIKVRNKNRKKKQKEPKSVLLLLGGSGAVPQDDDHIFTVENSLMFLNSNEPFAVPESLRNQVDEFESLYEGVSSSSAYQRLIDNKADLTRESLYEYFFEILDKHGPLELDSTEFVGEYEFFPLEAQKLVEEAGGLKPFLLESLRFFMIDDNLIGLMKHNFVSETSATRLPENMELKENNSETPSCPSSLNSAQNISVPSHWTLNPGAKEFKPLFEAVHNPTFPLFSSSFLPNSPTGDSVSSVNVADISVPTMQSEPAPFDIVVEKSALSFASAVALPLVSVEPYLQANTFMAPIPNIIGVQSLSVKESETGIHEYDTEAVFDRDCASTLIAPDLMEIYEDVYDTPKPHFSSDGDNLFLYAGSSLPVQIGGNLLDDKSKYGKELSPKRMVAVQVIIELSNHAVNTEPFHPFEKQQGDILRLEKEHVVLKEQLKKASEKYELSRSQKTDEIVVMEEQLQKLNEQNKVSKEELDWLYQDLEIEVKKWQQEKKELQERFKQIKNNIKVLTENNDLCLRNIEEKEQQYKTLLNEFLESSNKFENEKMKYEGDIKKGIENVVEISKRAIASEVSVLENQKNIEIFKLCCAMTSGQNNLRDLHSLGSSVSSSALPQLTTQIISWNSYLSSIDREIANIKSQFEERCCLVRSGVKLSSLQPVQVAIIYSPLQLPKMQGNASNGDPSITFSSSFSQLHNTGCLSSYGQGSVQPCITKQTGSNNEFSAGSNHLIHASVEIPYIPVERSSEQSSCSKTLQSRETNPDVSGSKLLSHVQQQSPQSLNLSAIKTETKNPFDKIIAHLKAIFPHYGRAELSIFIKETRVKNGSSFSGLNSNEIVSKVTEFILDYQSKPSPQKEMSSVEDPCIICHEELRQSTIYVLECGHRFHKHCIKTWLNAQSTCPTCRVHVLLSEDFPLLASRKRPT
ncbi:E3 ubiquitin-protein ligase TTC3-like isoform X3 [Pleurodeles waltl]|uniref:E3 ubiquitin-protein ligase TTC3-like isoform X3 n=1 Tax=Pleurodeles waltl TaxID=8319 RepID=UPI0037097F1C